MFTKSDKLKDLYFIKSIDCFGKKPRYNVQITHTRLIIPYKKFSKYL